MTSRLDPSAMHAAADMLEAAGSTGRYSEMRAFRQPVILGPGECTLDAGVGGQLPGNRCFLNNTRDLMTRACTVLTIADAYSCGESAGLPCNVLTKSRSTVISNATRFCCI